MRDLTVGHARANQYGAFVRTFVFSAGSPGGCCLRNGTERRRIRSLELVWHERSLVRTGPLTNI